MRIPAFVIALGLAAGLAAWDADARRFGGGGSLGKQRPAPTMREAPKQAPASTPAQQANSPAAPATAAAPAGAGAAAAKGGFMGRWGGLLAGLGIGAVLASLFGEQLGPIIGMLLAVMLFAGLAMLLLRMFGRKAAPAGAGMPGAMPGTSERRAQFAGIGSRVDPSGAAPEAPVAAGPVPAGFDVQAFERVAKTSFIRLQAANDAGDLDDIRDYTTPEMYAELAMQLKDRGGVPQRTEVLSLEAKVIEVAEEDGYEIASVRFWGVIREDEGGQPAGFDETWHVRKKMGDRRATWLIAGIQQNA